VAHCMKKSAVIVSMDYEVTEGMRRMISLR
jgi:hypothetical protein